MNPMKLVESAEEWMRLADVHEKRSATWLLVGCAALASLPLTLVATVMWLPGWINTIPLAVMGFAASKSSINATLEARSLRFANLALTNLAIERTTHEQL